MPAMTTTFDSSDPTDPTDPADAPWVELAGLAQQTQDDVHQLQRETAYRAALRVVDNARQVLMAQGALWRHVRTRGVYIVAGIGIREHDLIPVVVYTPTRDIDAPTWCRPVAEFLDGRFERV